MIHVCYGLYDKNGHYSKFTGTSILSMFENVPAPNSITVHILHDNTLTKDNRDKFLYLAEKYNQCIKFYNVEELCAEGIKHLQMLFANHEALKFLTVGTTFRLLVAQILPTEISKIIYLDSDTIVNLDINEFWKIPLEDKPLAAISEIEQGRHSKEFFILCKKGVIKPEDYFNAGVMTMNLEKLRGREYETLQKGIKFIAKNPIYNQYMDQEILNYAFSKDYLKLSSRFNSLMNIHENRKKLDRENRLIHYAGKSLTMDMNDPFNRLWFEYFEKTPWFNKEVIANLNDEYKKILIDFNTRLKRFTILSTVLISGKKRAFFFFDENVKTMKKIFSVKADEEVISLNDKEPPLHKLIKSMKNNGDDKIFFILFKDYSILHEMLIKEGFVEGQDFINAEMFLPKETDLKFDMKSLLYAM